MGAANRRDRKIFEGGQVFTIKGIGPTTVIGILAVIGDMRYFESSRQI